MDDILSEQTGAYSGPAPIGNSPQHQIALLDELRRSERQLAVSSITAVITHLVGTPLNVIVGRAGLIRRSPEATDPIISDALCIQQKVEQLTEKLRALLELFTPQAPCVSCRPNELLAEAVELYRAVADTRNVEVVFNRGSEVAGWIHRQPALTVVTSLLSLAVHEVAPGSTVLLSCGQGTSDIYGTNAFCVTIGVPGHPFDDPRQFARLEVKGSSSADSQQILGICAATARSAGGQLQVVTPSSSQTEICLRWPSTAAAPESSRAIPAAERSHRE
jgi:signal transduction histidine kinase